MLFHKKYNRPPNKTEDFNGEHIGTACNTLRLEKRNNTLAPELIRKLDKADFEWNPVGDVKTLAEKRLKVLKNFKKKHNRLPEPHEHYNGENVGKYIAYFKKARIKGSLKKDLESELNDIGFIWTERKSRKKRGKNKPWAKLMAQFYNEYAFFPKNNEVFKGENVGRGALYLRQRYRECKLAADVVDQLKKINFHWKTPSRHALMYNWAVMIKNFYDEKNRMPHKNERFRWINLGNVFDQLNR